MRIAFAITNAELVESTWTTTHLAYHALELGHDVRLIEPRDFEVTARGQLVARTAVLEPPCESVDALAQHIRSRTAPRRYTSLGAVDLLLLRVNPLTEDLLNLALLAVEQGTRVINDPAGVARTRSKAWLASLTDVPRPPTLVTSSRGSARLFAGNLDGPVVVKPAMSSGGRAVSLVHQHHNDDLEDAIDRAQSASRGPIVIQGVAPEAEHGEKRLFWVDGRVMGGYLRARPEGEFRHNLRLGSTPLPCEITDRDQALADAVSPHLLRNGIRIAGLDVIGGMLVEVNTLNPGGVHYADHFARLAQPTADEPPIGRSVIQSLVSHATAPPEASNS